MLATLGFQALLAIVSVAGVSVHGVNNADATILGEPISDLQNSMGMDNECTTGGALQQCSLNALQFRLGVRQAVHEWPNDEFWDFPPLSPPVIAAATPTTTAATTATTAASIDAKAVSTANATVNTTTEDPNKIPALYDQCYGECELGLVCKPDNQWYSQCRPFNDMYMMSTFVPNKELLQPSDAPVFTFYVYRAEHYEKSVPLENANAANLAGVIWYLHNEVVSQTPRKFKIGKIRRFKVQTKATRPLFAKGMNFGVRYAYDSGMCTGPWDCDMQYFKYGYFVGCNRFESLFPFPDNKTGYPDGVWYAFPGPCTSKLWRNSTSECVEAQPGGLCEGTPTGTGTCTYSYTDAGEISLDELTGIEDYPTFIREGNREFNMETDVGVNMSFWNGFWNMTANAERIRKTASLFHKKYPNMQWEHELKNPRCDFERTVFYGPTGKPPEAPLEDS